MSFSGGQRKYADYVILIREYIEKQLHGKQN
jgi:hypothetical protein